LLRLKVIDPSLPNYSRNKAEDKRKFKELKILGTGSTDFLCTRFDPDDTLIAIGNSKFLKFELLGTSDGHVQIYSLGSTGTIPL
jgi:hypothetical protein